MSIANKTSDTSTLRVEKIAADREQVCIDILGTAMSEDTQFEVEFRAPYEIPERPNLEEYATVSVQKNLTQGCVRISFSRMLGERDLLYCKLFVYEIGNGEVLRIPGPCYAELREAGTEWDYPYPTASTIKGLQVKTFENVQELGLGHAALNVNLPCIVQSSDENRAIAFPCMGRIYYFNRAYMEQLDGRIKMLSDGGTVVDLIILTRAEWHGVWGDPVLTPLLLHPRLDPSSIVSAFRVTAEEPLMLLIACMEFLAERYMRPDEKYGRACGWIIGNEVNAQWIYCNCGETDMDTFLSEYQIALRCAFYAVRKHYAQARVYISLDHCWNMLLEPNEKHFYRGKALLDALQRNVQAEGDFDWGVAYHPFPEDLKRADFWNDTTAIQSFDTGKITFRNVEILAAYLKQKQFLHRGKIRHIILSEQGLCSGDTPEGERLQADAFVLAFHKIKAISEIEAFIYHSHLDEKNEGLLLGLLAEDGRRKPIYDCFSAIDGPEGEELLRAACMRVGEENCRKIGLQ